METLNNLNEISVKKYEKNTISLKDLSMNVKYPILNCMRMFTKYGERIMLEIETNVIFLPQKYSKLTDDQIEDLCSGNFYFEKVKEADNNFILKFGM